MAYEFKDMATVDMVETVSDTASVLIEEDGVIKRAPKSEVGGGSKWDAVIEIIDDHTDINNFNLVSGTFSDIQTIALSGEKPNILIRYKYNYGDDFWDYLMIRHISVPDTTESVITIYFEIFNVLDNVYVFGINSSNEIVEC